ncbi:uncharacterized protein LOC126612334 isoform X4 [Malus sylvestris]|uniref:uncharacterized protein LOC126612334 isoform X4 n=1 Tax=Malus sylvestris TaxID=3752 RepID=UPI0021AB9C60|nr:uncharacterized protein LOC126612334 isoform X4 [Malus sylvestris]
MALIRTAANSDLRPLKWSSYFLLHFNSIVQLLNSVLRISFRLCGPMGVSALIRLGLMPRKPISLLWTPQPPGAVFQNPLSLGCRAAIPESEDVQKEEEEEEEESRGVSKAFSFVKNRRLPSLRAAFHETSSSPANFVYPLFIHEGRTTHLYWQCRDV